jgi:hypothetical protein
MNIQEVRWKDIIDFHRSKQAAVSARGWMLIAWGGYLVFGLTQIQGLTSMYSFDQKSASNFLLIGLLVPASLTIRFVLKAMKKKTWSTKAETVLEAQKNATAFADAYRDYANLIAEVNFERQMVVRDIDGLSAGFGKVLAYFSRGALFQAHIESEIGPIGDIEGAIATFADNTNVQVVTKLESSSTRHYHDDEGRIESSETSYRTSAVNFRSGTAAVSISGPKLSPGVILFESAQAAAEFTNIFNRAATVSASSKKNFKLEHKKAQKFLVDFDATQREYQENFQFTIQKYEHLISSDIRTRLERGQLDSYKVRSATE